MNRPIRGISQRAAKDGSRLTVEAVRALGLRNELPLRRCRAAPRAPGRRTRGRRVQHDARPFARKERAPRNPSSARPVAHCAVGDVQLVGRARKALQPRRASNARSACSAAAVARSCVNNIHKHDKIYRLLPWAQDLR
jgi:hypothetical protein